jgi:hypothetical protein
VAAVIAALTAVEGSGNMNSETVEVEVLVPVPVPVRDPVRDPVTAEVLHRAVAVLGDHAMWSHRALALMIIRDGILTGSQIDGVAHIDPGWCVERFLTLCATHTTHAGGDSGSGSGGWAGDEPRVRALWAAVCGTVASHLHTTTTTSSSRSTSSRSITTTTNLLEQFCATLLDRIDSTMTRQALTRVARLGGKKDTAAILTDTELDGSDSRS